MSMEESFIENSKLTGTTDIFVQVKKIAFTQVSRRWGYGDLTSSPRINSIFASK